MNRRLLALDTAEDIPLTGDLIVVGRHPTCDFRIVSSRVSRIHCCIHIAGERIFVRDLNSTNGVRINGRLVERSELKPGDVLSIGQIHFKCVENADAYTDTAQPVRKAFDRSEPRPVDEPPVAPIPMPGKRSGDSVDVRIRMGS